MLLGQYRYFKRLCTSVRDTLVQAGLKLEAHMVVSTGPLFASRFPLPTSRLLLLARQLEVFAPLAVAGRRG